MVCFKMSDLKRTKSYATLCVNIEFKNSKERSKANRLLEFDTDSTAADERRHNIEHMSKYISVKFIFSNQAIITDSMLVGTPRLHDACSAWLIVHAEMHLTFISKLFLEFEKRYKIHIVFNVLDCYFTFYTQEKL